MEILPPKYQKYRMFPQLQQNDENEQMQKALEFSGELLILQARLYPIPNINERSEPARSQWLFAGGNWNGEVYNFHNRMVGIVEFSDGVRRVDPSEIVFCDEENQLLLEMEKMRKSYD